MTLIIINIPNFYERPKKHSDKHYYYKKKKGFLEDFLIFKRTKKFSYKLNLIIYNINSILQ